MALNVKEIRKDFPALQVKVKNKPIIYLDNACMTLKPKQVVEAMNDYYYNYPGCHGRTNYYFGRLTTKEFNKARETLAKLINAPQTKEVIFVRNTSEGFNLIANSFPFQDGDIVLTTAAEHNSNLIPWQMLKRRCKIEHRILKLKDDLTFDLENLKENMSDRVKLVSMVHTSNLTGVTYPVAEIAKIAHRYGAYLMLDGAQSVPHHTVNVQDLEVDILAFSVHKMLGPTGTGVLWGKEEVLNKLTPFLVGGETVTDSKYDTCTFSDIPSRFEAGLQNYAGVIGAGVAAQYLMDLNLEEVHQHEISLNRIMTERLQGQEGIQILGPKEAEKRGGMLNIVIDKMNPQEVSRILDEVDNISVRAGAHCLHSWYNATGIPHSIRASAYIYNTPEECETFAEVLLKIVKHYR